MEKQEQNTQTETNQQAHKFRFLRKSASLLECRSRILTHRLGNDLKIEMPINLYKKILDLPFEKNKLKLLKIQAHNEPSLDL